MQSSVDITSSFAVDMAAFVSSHSGNWCVLRGALFIPSPNVFAATVSFCTP